MEFLASAVATHGYSILFAIVFMEAIGIPVPAALGLLIAGGAAAKGTLAPGLCVAFALSAMLLGDTLMYLLGKYTGWWLLGVLCRISLNPEACILQSADSFYKRGRALLVVAKFLPGINTMAPPLSGSMNMPAWQFLGLDSLAAILYTGVWFGSGFLFSGFLSAITRGYSAFGDVVTWIVAADVALWLAYRARLWHAARKLRPVRMIRASELADRRTAGRLSNHNFNFRLGSGDGGLPPSPGSPEEGRGRVFFVQRGEIPLTPTLSRSTGRGGGTQMR